MFVDLEFRASYLKWVYKETAFDAFVSNFLAMGGVGVGEEVNEETQVTKDVSLRDLSCKLDEFAKARDWEKYHSPRNLLLAMIGEVGELSEIFQWRGEVERGLPNWKEADKEHLGEELSDVLMYLIRLADVCGVDLGDAAIRKIVKNGIKYPPNNKP